MKKILHLASVCLGLLFLLLACSPVNDNLQKGTTEPTTESTNEPIPPLDDFEELSLMFNDTKVCSRQGVLTTFKNWKSTSYINVSRYRGIWYELAGNSKIQSVSFYDADKTYLNGCGTTSICAATVCQGYVAVPSNAVYARFVQFEGSAEKPTWPAMETQCVIAYESDASYEDARKTWKYDGIRIACLGDSLTEGDYGDSTGSVANRRLKNYPYFLAKELGCETVNYGQCGYNAQTYGQLYQGGTVLINDADIIVVMLGTNRGLGTSAGTDYGKCYSDLIEKILTDKKENAVLVLLTPISSTVRIDSVASACNYILGDVATKYESRNDVVIIDAFTNSPIQPNQKAEYQAVDSLHLTESGYRAFAKYLAEELRKLL